jgi:hypothetical protein
MVLGGVAALTGVVAIRVFGVVARSKDVDFLAGSKSAAEDACERHEHFIALRFLALYLLDLILRLLSLLILRRLFISSLYLLRSHIWGRRSTSCCLAFAHLGLSAPSRRSQFLCW